MAPENTELSAWLDGELSPEERRRVRARLHADPAYARELEELERTRTMLAACIEERGFTSRLLPRLYEEEKRLVRAQWTRRTAALAAAACILLILSLGAWVLMQQGTPPPENSAPMAAPPRQAPESDTMLMAATEPPETDQDAAVPETAAAMPEFELLGTITGGEPQAIIAVTIDGNRQSGSYAAGDVIAEGITVLEISQGAAVLDVRGEEITVAKGNAAISNPVDRLEGHWKLGQISGNRTFEMDHITIEREGMKLKIYSTGSQQNILVDYRLSGRELYLSFPQKEGFPYPREVVGYLDADFHRMDIEVLIDEKGEEFLGDEQFYAEWFAPLDTGDEKERREAQAACMEDMQKLADALKKYAAANAGNYPASLGLLAPEYLQDADLLEKAGKAPFKYSGGSRPESPKDLPRLSLQPIATFPNRAMAHEAALRNSPLQKFMFRKPVLTLGCADGGISIYIDSLAGIRTVPVDNAWDADGIILSSQLNAMRASCQNNLKQLGLVVKMFENEQGEYTPPGWLTVYPEYLTDPNILTSPIDPPGTDSYQLIHQAVHTPSLVEEFAINREIDLNNPAGRAMAQSEIPVVIQRSEWPGPTPGRNVLFLDGHVEYVRSGSGWEERIQPWLQ